MTSLSALTLCCTLKPSPAPSSSERLGREVLTALEGHGFSTDFVRVVDHDVKFGIETDMGDGDQWPSIREKVLAADVLVIATPIWMGQPASVCKLVMERLNAELSETDEAGRMTTAGKVAVVAVVGNEDGAHHTAAEVFQGLADVGFTIPAEGSTYWVGEAMQPTDYLDKDPAPEKTQQTTATVAAHAAHLARLLKESNYPA